MSAGKRCRECGTLIASGSPDALCPKCLFGLGLGPKEEETASGDSAVAPEGVIAVEQPSQVGHGSASAIPVSVITEQPGDRIGPYKLLQEIGTGGFGIVYMAQQQEPVKRRVALKIVKLGMDTKQVVARFEAERQALALMDHPNIAKMLDAGATSTGRPYFVMELVKGIRITEYCDQNHLSTRERLELFIQICRAVQHAHQKGIIHRDLKPSNILVTLHDSIPVPKIIDFGIAKATLQELTEQTVFTQFGQFIGTPAYMSPEQAEMSGLDVDTRTDIYSLGVLLYELLTGKTPFDSKELLAAGLEEMRRMLREKEPARPSTRLSTLLAAELTSAAKCRRVEAPKLVKLIRGDLDWIVMKCLEKDRTRRYESASGFAEDIENFLRNEPVKARPASQFYRLQRFARRHKVAFAGGAVVAASVLMALAISSWLLVREKEARENSQETVKYLKETFNVFNVVKPAVARGRDTQLLRDILDDRAAALTKYTKLPREARAELCNAIGEVYREVGELVKAEQMYHRALELLGKPAKANRVERARSLNDLGLVLRDQGTLTEAETLHREALALYLECFGAESREYALVLNNLALVLRRQMKLSEAELLQRKALVIQTNIFGYKRVAVATSLSNLGLTLIQEGKYADADGKFREALGIQKELDQPLEVAITTDNLGVALRYEGKLKEAEEKEQEALDGVLRFYDQEHSVVATVLHNQAVIWCEEGRRGEPEKLAKSEDQHRTALLMRRKRSKDHAEIAMSLDNLARVLRLNKNLAEAKERAEEGLAMRIAVYHSEDHPMVANSLNTLALVLHDQGNLVDAEHDFDKALALEKKWFGDEHPQIAATLNDLALLLRDKGDLPSAENKMRKAVEMRKKWLGEQHPLYAESAKELENIIELKRKAASASKVGEEPKQTR